MGARATKFEGRFAYDPNNPRYKVEVQGLKEVIKNLNLAMDKLGGATLQGLIKSAIMIRRATEQESPLTPVDTGNLRASFFIVASGGSVGNQVPLTGTGTFHNHPQTRSKIKKKSKYVGKADRLAKNMSTDYSRMVNKYLSKANSMGKPNVFFGYSAYYAAYVHESVGKRVTSTDISGKSKTRGKGWSRPGSGPKWFEAAVKRKEKSILSMIKREASKSGNRI